MDELVEMVARKTGLSEDMARKAVEMVIGFVKDRLPAPIAAQVDNVVGGGGGGGGLSGLAGSVGGLFGGRE